MSQHKPGVILSHGGVQFSYPLAYAIQEAGFLKAFWTTIYSYKNPKHRKFFSGYFTRRHAHFLDEQLIHSYIWPEVIRRAASCLVNRFSTQMDQVVYYTNQMFDRHVARRVARASFDLFIGLSGSALASIRQAKAMGKRAIVDQHDIHFSLGRKLVREEIELDPDFSSSFPNWPPLERYLDDVQREIELADYILVPSTFARRSHIEAGVPDRKLITLFHGFHATDHWVRTTRQKKEPFRILFVGQLTQRKGIKYLLEAVKQLHHPQMELLMIGDRMVSSRSLAPYRDFFRYERYVPYERLSTYFDRAHVLVLPSIYDAFGLVALDAMSRGVPVIVSENTAAGSDVVRSGTDGFVVPIRNVEILKEKILYFFENEDSRMTMAQNARERVQGFSVHLYKQHVREIIQDILTEKNPRPSYVS
ncbi:MAG: glycosyltransferase family 4 protein [Candidatus Omnitrophica bacterium]|nr:glycosyltransferase family 4 protein [Candidatus Omnitrophota bacterium]